MKTTRRLALAVSATFWVSAAVAQDHSTTTTPILNITTIVTTMVLMSACRVSSAFTSAAIRTRVGDPQQDGAGQRDGGLPGD